MSTTTDTTLEQWRRIMFDNPVEMYQRGNPSFFDGTPVADYLAAAPSTARHVTRA